MDVGVEEPEQRDTASQQHRRAGEHDVVDQAAAEPVLNDLAAADIDRCRASLSEQPQRFPVEVATVIRASSVISVRLRTMTCCCG